MGMGIPPVTNNMNIIHTTVIFVSLRLCLPVSTQSAVRYIFLHTIAYAEQPFDTRGSMVLLLPSS